MKNKFLHLSSKCLAFFLAFLMMLSCFSAVSFAAEEENDEKNAHGSVTTFSDGVYTVTIDANKLFEMIDNGKISRERIKELSPQELYDAITSNGSVSARLLSLLKAYVNLATAGDFEALYELLPVDMTMEYLTQEPDPLLWRVLSKETLFDSIDLPAILSELNRSGKLSEILNINEATDIALRDGLVTEEAITAMINDLKENDPTAYHAFMNEVSSIVLSNPEFEAFCQSVIKRVLNDATATAKLTALVDSSDTISKLIARDAIDVDGLAVLIDSNALHQLIEDEAVDMDGLAVQLGSGFLGSLTIDELINLINANGGVPMLIENDLLDIGKTIAVLGGYTVLIEKDLVNVYAFIQTVGDAEVLLTQNIVNVQWVREEVDSLRAIALKMQTSYIIDIFGFTRILNTVGGDVLVGNPHISGLIDYTTLFKFLVEDGYIQSIKSALLSALNKEALFEVASAYMLNFSQSISINGEEIYSAYDSKIDIDRLTQILAEAMPTFDKLAADPVNPFTLVVDWELNERNIDPETTKSHYTFGIQVKISGDTARLAALCEKLAGYVSIVNQGEKTTVKLNVPAKFAALYLQAINTDLLPADLRTKLLSYLDQEITEDNINAILSDFTVEEIATIVEQIDFARFPEVVDKILELYPTYRRALSIAKRAVNAMTYDKLLSIAQRLGIDQIENGLENNEEKIRALRDKILSALDSMADEAIEEALRDGNFGDYSALLADEIRANAELLNTARDYLSKAITKAFEHAPENLVGTKLCDHYKKNGQFGPIQATFAYDVEPLLDKLLGSKLSDETLQYAKGFLKNTEITRNVSVQITFDDIYEAKFINLDGDTVYVTYLPTDADLSVIYQLPALQEYDNEWTYDGETPAQVMPAKDIRLTVFDPLHEHNLEFVKTVAPTCEEEGYDLYRCDCQFEEHRNIQPALGHIIADRWTIAIKPNRHSTGKAILGCIRENCNMTCEETILPALHDPNDPESWWYYLIEEDFTGYCHQWSYIYTFLLGTDPVPYELKVPAGVQHIYDDEWITTREPSIRDGGEKKRVCKTCGYEDYDVVEKLNSGYKDLTTSSGVIISGWFADGLLPVANDMIYNGSVWASADGIEDVDTIKVMDIHIADLDDRYYDSTIGLTVTIPIPKEHKNRDLVVYHKLHDGTFEKFANNDDTLDDDHRLTVVDIQTMLGTTPAVRFTVYSFSEFLIGMIHEHEYGAWSVENEPTLTSGGNLVRYCVDPDNNEIHEDRLVLPALSDIDYDLDRVSDSDCEHTGLDRYTYSDPNYTDANGQFFAFDVIVDALGHSWGDWVKDIDPTRTSTGQLKRECQRDDCDEVDEDEIPAFNTTDYRHTPISGATCENPGSEKYTYLNSDYKDANGQLFEFTVEIPATGHDWGHWEVTTEPTKTTPGLLTRVCGNDGTHTDTHELSALTSSDYTCVVDPATCTDPGSETYTYTNSDYKDANGQPFEFTVTLDPINHSYGQWVVTTEPTKTTAGLLTKVCANNSGHTETYALPKLDNLLYNYTLVSGASCTETGTEKYVFVKDGQTFEFTVTIPAKNHAFGEWEIATAPTLTGEGTLQKVCANDPTHKETHTLPALNKTDYEYKVVTAPLCEAKGSAKYIYSFEGKTFEFALELDSLGHKFADWTVRVNPTLTTTGELVRICTNDPMHEETHKLPAFNEAGAYTYKVITEPTATEDGSAVYTYTFDGKAFEFNVVLPATGETEPEDGFPWWIILIIVLALIIIGVIIFFIFFKPKNDKKPPEAPVAPVVPVVEEKEEKVEEEEIIEKVPVTPAPAVVVPTMAKRNGKKSTVNLTELNEFFSEGDTVSLETLKAKGLLSQSVKRYKVLANGTVEKALTVEADEFTAQAKEKILAAGGNTVLVRIQR